MKNTVLLNKILTNHAQTASSICVFDLDSTLFNVAPRTEQILKEFAKTHNYPDLAKISVHPSDWGLREILIREGYDMSALHSENMHLHKTLIDFWTKNFFTNEYLQFDTPYLGAVHFVQTLFQKNIEVHYLTGRDIFRMGTGTKNVLLKWGFPIQSDSHLHLKPHKDLDDHEFKLNWVLDFKNQKPNSEIYFFENEPVNINAIGNVRRDIQIIYLNTTHSRKDVVSVPVYEIENFSLAEDI
jgi:hypothetical protein